MTSPSSLLALEGKLVEAKEGSRELTIEMMRTLGFKWNGHLTIDNGFGRWERHDGDLADLAFLDSIDSALALVNRVNAGRHVKMTIFGDGSATAFIGDGWREHGSENRPTPALALCLALIRSLKGAGE